MLTPEMARYVLAVRSDVEQGICQANIVLCGLGDQAILNHWWMNIRPRAVNEPAGGFVRIEDYARSLGYIGPGLDVPVPPGGVPVRPPEPPSEIGSVLHFVEQHPIMVGGAGLIFLLFLMGKLRG